MGKGVGTCIESRVHVLSSPSTVRRARINVQEKVEVAASAEAKSWSKKESCGVSHHEAGNSDRGHNGPHTRSNPNPRDRARLHGSLRGRN